MVCPLRKLGRARLGGFLTLLLLLLAGVQHGAQASVAELSPVEGEAACTRTLEGAAGQAAPHAKAASEPAQCRVVLHDAPPLEIGALEPETNEDPAGPDAPSIFRLVFGSAATVASVGQVLPAVSVTYSGKLAASCVLARAPPLFARAPEGARRHGAR
ncbi:MAG: hypothetical protein JWN04_5676 [Myxococcaceae bacterium]|nr:hypothetical protein [Myxococcaceae bacterium]